MKAIDVVLPQLLEEYEGENGLGAESHEGRNVALTKKHRAIMESWI